MPHSCSAIGSVAMILCGREVDCRPGTASLAGFVKTRDSGKEKSMCPERMASMARFCCLQLVQSENPVGATLCATFPPRRISVRLLRIAWKPQSDCRNRVTSALRMPCRPSSPTRYSPTVCDAQAATACGRSAGDIRFVPGVQPAGPTLLEPQSQVDESPFEVRQCRLRQYFWSAANENSLI